MASTSSAARRLARVDPNRLAPWDSRPITVVALSRATVDQIRKATGVPAAVARAVVEARRARPLSSVWSLQALPKLAADDRERLQRVALLQGDGRIAITDVQPAAGRIMSGQPFALRVSFAAGDAAEPVLVSVAVEWAGEPFVVERRLTAADLRAGRVDVKFDARQTLPTGPASFAVSLFGAQGAHAVFRTSCAVLPSNPFSLSVSPDHDFVTGTFSARSVKRSGKFETHVRVRLSNGDGAPVPVSPSFDWTFWDGGVGSSNVEHGTASFGGGSITVPAHGVWDGFIAFTSPGGSGVFDKLNGREDLTLQIVMRHHVAIAVSGTITVRTMFRFGINVTRVSWEAFTSTEESDLDAATAVMRSIYERRDLTLDFDPRGISRSRVGGYETITSENEARDLFDDWSGPDTNQNIDVFISHLVGTDFDGLAGGIPGPTSHHGRDSGVVVDKHGHVDSAGVKHLDIDYHGMVMAHEVGHYLGLSHVDEAHNLMLWNSDRDDTHINYDPQYRTMIRHGWVHID
jgi:Metallo-peptidase family M12B Reprolysin-like